MTRLRDGSIVEDPRLDLIPWFDPRNADYPLRALLPAPAKMLEPRSYTWGCDTWLDQGPFGACVGHALAHDIYARPAEHPQVGPDHPNPLAFELYWEAQRRDRWPGGEYPGASPFDGGTDLQSAAMVAIEMGFFTEFRWANDPHELAVGMTRAGGGPAQLACPWTEAMMQPDEDGYIDPDGPELGWHAICVRSYSVRYERFGLHQSWGNRADGLWWLSWESMRRLWDMGAHAYLPVGRRLRVPIPTEAT